MWNIVFIVLKSIYWHSYFDALRR